MPTSAAVLTRVCARSVRRWSSEGPSEAANRSTISTRPSSRANVSGVSAPWAMRAACSRSTAPQTWANAPSSSSSRPSSASERPPPDSTTSASLDSVVPATTTLGTGTPRVPASRVTNPSCSTCCWRVSATGAAPRYQTERHRRDSSWVSRASRPWTLTTIGRPAASVPSTRSTPLGWRAASCRSVASRSTCASAAATSANEGRPHSGAQHQMDRRGGGDRGEQRQQCPGRRRRTEHHHRPCGTPDAPPPEASERQRQVRRRGERHAGAQREHREGHRAGGPPGEDVRHARPGPARAPAGPPWRHPSAATEVSTTSTSTSPRRRTNAVTTTTSVHSSSAAAPRRHTTSSVEGTSSMTPISACLEPGRRHRHRGQEHPRQQRDHQQQHVRPGALATPARSCCEERHAAGRGPPQWPMGSAHAATVGRTGSAARDRQVVRAGGPVEPDAPSGPSADRRGVRRQQR